MKHAEVPGPAGSTQTTDLEQVARAAVQVFGLDPEPGADGDNSSSPGRTSRLNADPETVERDLARLVLTLVELLRQLMERSALRRVDEGGLTEEQEERVGMTLMLLQDRMTELCARHGLSLDDLNLDLGPLGSLLPRTR